MNSTHIYCWACSVCRMWLGDGWAALSQGGVRVWRRQPPLTRNWQLGTHRYHRTSWSEIWNGFFMNSIPGYVHSLFYLDVSKSFDPSSPLCSGSVSNIKFCTRLPKDLWIAFKRSALFSSINSHFQELWSLFSCMLQQCEQHQIIYYDLKDLVKAINK